MGNRKIHIENLKIRLPRSSAGEARSIAGALGSEILHRIAESASGKTGEMKIGELSVANVAVPAGASPGAIQDQIARRVANAVKKRFE